MTLKISSQSSHSAMPGTMLTMSFVFSSGVPFTTGG